MGFVRSGTGPGGGIDRRRSSIGLLLEGGEGVCSNQICQLRSDVGREGYEGWGLAWIGLIGIRACVIARRVVACIGLGISAFRLYMLEHVIEQLGVIRGYC